MKLSFDPNSSYALRGNLIPGSKAKQSIIRRAKTPITDQYSLAVRSTNAWESSSIRRIHGGGRIPAQGSQADQSRALSEGSFSFSQSRSRDSEASLRSRALDIAYGLPGPRAT